jgi:hypothetical protein
MDPLDTMDPRSLTNFFNGCCQLLRGILFKLFYLVSMPRPSAWTAQQKWYAIDPKRKSPDKKPDDIIRAIKAEYDRDVSALTLHGWLKPENAAKIEQLANASGQSDAKRQRICNHPELERFHFITKNFAQNHEIRIETKFDITYFTLK